MRVNYIYKKESDPSLFTSSGSIIELKEYTDDLVFYSPMNDMYRAEYCLYDKIAKYETKPEVFTGGHFGSYLKLTDSYRFDLNNFDNIDDTCRVSFYLGTNKLFETTKAALREKKDFPKEGLPEGSYSISVLIDGKPSSTLTLKLREGSTTADIKNKIMFKLDPMIYPFSVNIINNEPNTLIFQSLYEGKSIKISDGLDGINLLDYYDIDYIENGSAPKQTVEVFKLFNLSVEHFKNTIKGSDESWLRFKLGEQVIELPWNSNSIDLDNIEIDIGDNLIYIFINGKLMKVEMLTDKLVKNGQTLELCGTKEAPYSFDEIIINKKCIHRKDFELDNKQLTKYSVKKPYIDFNFAGSEIRNGMELKTAIQNGIHCSLCEDGNFYHWSAGSWRRCTGEYEHSNDFESFSAKLKEFNFSGKDFYIRMFFFSDGIIKSYIDTPYFELDDEAYADKNGNTSAILIGDKSWIDENGNPVLEDLAGKTLIIMTDQGTTEIYFSPYDENGELIKPDMYDVDRVIETINSYYPDGIYKCVKDPDGRVMLISETKGKDAYIMVKGDAAPLIFGKTHYAKGEDANAGSIDYTKFFDTVRTYTSKLLISEGEIPDEQMMLYLREALEYYKKWRGEPINQYTCQLKGNWKDGYEIPSVIETQKDIVDIIFKPIFPILFYGSDFIANGAENIFTLTLAQSIFGGRGGMRQAHGITQDFYISLMGMQDFKQALGLNPSWEILNNRIYIYPSQVSRFTNVCIKYKAPLSEEECLKDPDIIKYVHGKCLMTMGNVRGQYGGDLTNGETALKFNADSLYERGKVFVDEVIQLWQKQQPPLGFFFG